MSYRDEAAIRRFDGVRAVNVDRERLRMQLIADEGCVLHAYQDSLGWWTIGVGHLIDKRKGGSIPAAIAYALLESDIDETVQKLAARLSWLNELDPVRQATLINMAFNLGVDGLLEFKNTLAAVKRGDYVRAANGMRSSLWAKQVKGRAVRLSLMMETGRWPNELNA